jgi:hypothetical protein
MDLVGNSYLFTIAQVTHNQNNLTQTALVLGTIQTLKNGFAELIPLGDDVPGGHQGLVGLSRGGEVALYMLLLDVLLLNERLAETENLLRHAVPRVVDGVPWILVDLVQLGVLHALLEDALAHGRSGGVNARVLLPQELSVLLCGRLRCREATRSTRVVRSQLGGCEPSCRRVGILVV